METSQIILFSLALSDLVLVGMAVIRINQRHLPWFDRTAWLLLTLLVPYLGPFLTIMQRSNAAFEKAEQPHTKNKAR